MRLDFHLHFGFQFEFDFTYNVVRRTSHVHHNQNLHRISTFLEYICGYHLDTGIDQPCMFLEILELK